MLINFAENYHSLSILHHHTIVSRETIDLALANEKIMTIEKAQQVESFDIAVAGSSLNSYQILKLCCDISSENIKSVFF